MNAKDQAKALALKPTQATIYLSVSGLFPDASLVVLGVAPPKPGTKDPVCTELSVILEDTDGTDGIAVPVKADAGGTPTELAIGGLMFAATVLSDKVTGTVTIGIMRDQDTPTSPPYDRPIATNVQLTRKAGDPLYRTVTIAIQKDG